MKDTESSQRRLVNPVDSSTDEDEDLSPVLRSEIWGLYGLCIAMEPAALVILGILGPLCQQSLAAQSAWTHLDHSQACNTTGSYQCDVNLGNGIYIDTSALVLYSTSFSVIFQMLLFIPIGSMADYGNRRRVFVFFFCALNALFGILILFALDHNSWWISFISVNLSGIFLGAAYVLGLAYIPILARNTPEVIEARLKGSLQVEEEVFDKIGNDISSEATQYCSIAALLVYIVAAGFVLATGSVDWSSMGFPSTYSMQIAMASCSCFQIIVLIFFAWPRVKTRPGKRLPPGETYASQSFKSLRDVVRKAYKLKQLFTMLLAWFCYSDSFSTVASMSILFAQSALGATTFELLIAAGIMPLASALGAKGFTYIQTRFNVSTRQILVLQSSLYILIPLWGCVGFFTSPGSFGLQNKNEIYAVASFHGLLFGATQSSCRVLFSELIPKGHESKFFGLYEITDKGSSWVGPLVVGVITSATGNIRYSFIFLSFFFLIPIYLFSRIDEKQGKIDATRFEMVSVDLKGNVSTAKM